MSSLASVKSKGCTSLGPFKVQETNIGRAYSPDVTLRSIAARKYTEAESIEHAHWCWLVSRNL